MPYTPELIARIRRLHFHEHYTIHAVSKVVDLHRDTVKRILYGDDSPDSGHSRPKLTNPYLSVITEHLENYPSICCTKLFRIMKDRGYCGSYNSLRRAVYPLRKKKKVTFKPMEVFKGEQGQVDWAHCGSVEVKGGSRKVYLFVLVLSWSRAVFAKFTFDQKTDSFLRLHEEAFYFFGGTPRNILYDNLKSAVIERFGKTVKFNQQLVEFSGCYGYKPVACRPYAGNQKGRVERTIRYIRDSFLSGYRLTGNLDKANQDLEHWLATVANKRPWSDNKTRQLDEVLAEEKTCLLKLPPDRFMPVHSQPVRSNKCSLVRFDLNDYSIPHEYSREMLTVRADDFTVKFYSGLEQVAEHSRSWCRGERIAKPEHWKRNDRSGLHTTDNLISEYPELINFYRVLTDRGEPLRATKKAMKQIHDLYGSRLFRSGLRIAGKREMYHPSQLTRILIGLEKAGEKAPGKVRFGNRKDLEDLSVTSHNLETYDNL